MSKISFFLYSTKFAGVENYLINLINSWPNKTDKISIIINYNFAQMSSFKNSFKRKIKFSYYKDNMKQNSITTESLLNRLIVKTKFIWFFFFYKNFLYKNFNDVKIDKLFLINGGYPGSLYHLIVARKWKYYSGTKPWMVIHNYPKKKKISNFYYEYLVDFLFSKCLHGIVTISKSCLSTINKIYFLKKIKKKLILNGIEAIKITKLYKRHKNKFNILMMAVFEERKGFDYIFDCMVQLKKKKIDFTLHLYGDYKKNDLLIIKEMIKSRNLKNFVTINAYEKDKKKIFTNKDILVLPSKYEPFGLVLIEAMMFKIPTISTNLGGPSEIIKNGKNGFLVQFGNINDMCKKIKILITDKKRYKSISNNGYKTFNTKFNSKIMSKNYFEILK